MNHAPPRAPHAALARRALALVYEALLLAAVLLAGALPFVMLAPAPDSALTRFALQCYLLVLCGVYYIWQWLRGGQTLPMKTWRIRLVTRDGAALDLGHGLRRYFYALAGTALLGTGFLWALVDRDRQFLHDRLAGTRLVAVSSEQ